MSQLRSSNFNQAYQQHAASAFDLSRDELIEAHLPQVRFIAERLAVRLPASVDRDDLISAGVLGLLDAVEKFDAGRGLKFKTYAEQRVRGAMLDFLRGLDWCPRSLRRNARAIETASAQLETLFGRPATEDEIAAQLGISLLELQQLQSDLSGVTIASLDDANDTESDANFLALQVADTASLAPDRACEHHDAQSKLIVAIDNLPERERQVVALYYLEELTMKQVGIILDLTESRVSQIHTQAVLRLRGALKN